MKSIHASEGASPLSSLTKSMPPLKEAPPAPAAPASPAAQGDKNSASASAIELPDAPDMESVTVPENQRFAGGRGTNSGGGGSGSV